MNKYADRGVGNEELGDCKHREGLAGGVVGVSPAEFPRFLFASLIEVPLVRVPQGKKLRKTGRVDTEVWNKLIYVALESTLAKPIKLWWPEMFLWGSKVHLSDF